MSAEPHRDGTDAAPTPDTPTPDTHAPDALASHRRHLGRGFNWLGGATIIAKVIDFSTIVAVLLFLTKEQVGIASLVVSIAMIVEAFDGLGTSEALVQAKTLTRRQLDTLFWFVVGAATLVAGVTLMAAPAIEAAYGVAGMAGYFVAAAVKQPLVGAALIPLALMNRDLQFERIAIVNVAATLAAALTRLGLAMAGAGAWAVVAGYAASGLYILIGAMAARPFWPRLRFALPEILPLVRFGIRAAASNIAEQIFKNVDYLLIGWFYGAAPLAIYRVGFDITMEPAMAVGTLVNRTALPVFARVAASKDALAQSLLWSLRRLVSLVAPLMAGLMLAATPLTALIRDQHGNSYAAAALPLQVLAAAGLLRVTSQLLTPVLMAAGRPGLAARLSVATLLLLTFGIAVAGFCFPAATGIVAVSAVWLGIYPLLIAWGVVYLRRHWGVRVTDLARAFAAPLVSTGVMVLLAVAAQRLVGSDDPRLQLGLVIAAMALTYGGLFRYARLRPA
ncbi:lipopolysaccharide biosynthesis protein [Aliidongia dinghuensis]|uniref:Lipopolysaccharide biosynthesis protein n=1 Tax=Aliidongia dinghuensis TaxID=1867774 RepID=A0A8J2YZT3_9PROT|nr:oligosaccharide flippase family protein [Aliidongia dinghuensis]GGF47306.1 lipopolysaccharide biosynthesis protein [Aliidongia dinghuensis]